ncbi:MAG: tRNA (adenosine(37)-N6)-dimethylallyltransferase MiaA [Odoribacteraceae bacterium]|jgi:tRNA dimethylallyltransferase|nr:tRNA (adenosine(37)-N6)-dimethylallyltransferase MiaA [Odoribacteraceae bacterium]
MSDEPYNTITILGPTASGKTALAARVAAAAGGEIISADSRQLYRGMDIGTGKDLDEYVIDGRRVPCHLVDIAEAGYRYNLFEYQRDFRVAWEDCRRRGVLPVLCGGSGMYIEAILQGYRLTPVPANPALRAALSSKTLPELAAILASYRPLHNTTDTCTVARATRAIEIAEHYRAHPAGDEDFPRVRSLVVGIALDRERRRDRVTRRLHDRLQAGMIEETRALLSRGVKPEDLIYYGLEYKYTTLHLTGTLSRDEMVERLNTAIHRFAKRQMTWFRKMERQGINIRWLDGDMSLDDNLSRVLEWYSRGDHET